MFCSNKTAEVFTHQEMFLVWHLGDEAGFCSWDWLLSDYWWISAGVLAFQAFLHLPFVMHWILFPFVISHYYAFYGHKTLVLSSCVQHFARNNRRKHWRGSDQKPRTSVSAPPYVTLHGTRRLANPAKILDWLEHMFLTERRFTFSVLSAKPPSHAHLKTPKYPFLFVLMTTETGGVSQ